MIKIVRFTSILFILFTNSVLAEANPFELTESLFESFKKDLSPTLSYEERLVFNKISLEINNFPGILPIGAFNQNSEPKITMSENSIVVLAMLARAMGISSWLAETEDAEDAMEKAVESYTRYLASLSLFDPNNWQTFDEFVKLTEADIQFYDASVYKDKEITIRMTYFMYIFMHESAHHILGHTQDFEVTSSVSIQRELRADEWAFVKLIRTSLQPALLPSMFLMYAELDAIDSDGQSVTHPRNIERAINALTIGKRFYSPNYSASSFFNDDLLLDINGKLSNIILHLEKINSQNSIREKWKPDDWYKLESAGDLRANLHIASSFHLGSNGFEYSQIKSRRFYCSFMLSNEDVQTSDLLSVVETLYLCGMSLAHSKELKTSFERAKPLFCSAAEYGYLPAIKALDGETCDVVN